MRRRSLALGFSIVFLATCGWAQRYGGGTRVTAGGPRTGINFTRPQTVRPASTRTVSTFDTRGPVAPHIGGRFRHQRSFGYSPYYSNGFAWNDFYTPYYNSFFPCADPYSTLSAYCTPFLTFGSNNYGAGPFAGAGYVGDPRFVLVADGNRDDDEPSYPDGENTVEIIPNPPRADALDETISFRRVDPRDAVVILNGQPQPAETSGGPLTIGSGSNTLLLTAKSGGADPAPPTSQKENPTK